MREFQVSIMPQIMRGLRSRKHNLATDFEQESNRRGAGLVRAFNIMIHPDGIGPYEPVEIPFDGNTVSFSGLDLDWPYPQLFKGKQYKFVTTKNRVFFVNPDWTLNEITEFTGYANNQTTNIKLGHSWQLMDFWRTWMLTNGRTVIWQMNADDVGGTKLGLSDNEIVTFWSNDIRVNSICDHMGRGWMGGFDPDFNQADQLFFIWDELIKEAADSIGSTVNTDLYKGLGKNSVWWSSIGGGDLFSMWSLSKMTSGFISSNYGTARPYFVDLLLRNESSSMVMPWEGEVRRLKPLGKYIIVYGDGGVSALAPSGSAVGLIDSSKFGGNHSSGIQQGIASSQAVGGNANEHVFLDGSGTLWHLSSDLALEKLDFREFLWSMVGQEVCISCNGRDRLFYICDGYKGYVLSLAGGEKILTEHGQQVTSVIESEGGVLGLGTGVDYMTSQDELKKMEIITDSIDFASRGSKTLAFADVYGDVPEIPHGDRLPSVQVGADFKYKLFGDKVKSGRYVSVNQNGSARIGVTAPDIRFKMKVSDFRDFHLDDVVIKWQNSDKRFDRGVRVERI